MTKTTMPDENDLPALLHAADVGDIITLIDYITDSGKGRLTLEEKICNQFTECKAKEVVPAETRTLLAFEILRFGGNSYANLFRDAHSSLTNSGKTIHGVNFANTISYEEALRDVAKHSDISFGTKTSILTIEGELLQQLLRESLDSFDAEQRKTAMDYLKAPIAHVKSDLNVLGLSTMATLGIAQLVAGNMSRLMLGRGLTMMTSTIVPRTAAVALGPIAWAAGGIWTLADLASPAYRVTVPCIVQIAYIRQKLSAKMQSSQCPNCKSVNLKAAKFCSDCGGKLPANV